MKREQKLRRDRNMGANLKGWHMDFHKASYVPGYSTKHVTLEGVLMRSTRGVS